MRHAVLRTLILAAFLLPAAFQQGEAAPRDERRLILLHTNDVHSWFAPRPGRLAGGVQADLGGAPVLAGLVREFRNDNPGQVLYLDAGDLFQGTPISTLTRGMGCIEVFNLLQPDAFAVGNHEYDYGLTAQQEAMAAARFPVLQANVCARDDGELLYPADLLVTRQGLRVLVLGLVTDALEAAVARENVADVRVRSSEEVAREWLAETSGRADLRIALTHCGYYADSLLALRVPGFDMIVGGHSHTLLRQPVKIGGTWVAQAGCFGRYLGVDTLWVAEGGGIEEIRGGVIPVTRDRAEAVPEVASLVMQQESRVNAMLAEQIAVLETDWLRNWSGESNIGNWLAAAARENFETDLAFWNNGGIRKDQPAGPLRLRDIWEIAPFGNELLIAHLSGGQVRGLIDHVLQGGMEFLPFDGLRVEFDERGRPAAFQVGGENLSDERTYSAVFSDYVWGRLEGAPFLAAPRVRVEHTGRIDRDVLIAAARAQGNISSRVDGRWGWESAGP